MRPKLKFAINLVYSLLVVVLIVFGAAIALSVFAGPGNFRLLTVQSGSMEPSLKFGSIILVLPKSQKIISPTSLPKFQPGEIVTYLSGKETFTHRIVSIEQTEGKIFYQTKGDANPGEDVEKIPEDRVTGKVAFSLPYLGYFISFAKTQMGFIALIIIPATLIIYSETLVINTELRKIIADRRESKEEI